MLLNKEKTAGNRKYYCILLLSFGLTILGAKAFAQAPPPPPPPGELFNKINPFKKNKTGKDSAKKKDTAKAKPVAAPAGGPPPPPNPLNLFKKKKKDTTKTSKPSQKA